MAWDWTVETLAALGQFLESRGILDGDITAKPIGEGHSNLTFLVSDATSSVVVRRPPPPPIPAGAHDVLREARLLSALIPSAVPIPEVLAVAQAGEVLDVPFYVMSFVDGHVVTTATPSPLRTVECRRAIGYEMIDILAELHAVDWRAHGFEKVGRPEGFNRRHLQRMRRLVVEDNHRMPGQFADVDHWLQENVPPNLVRR